MESTIQHYLELPYMERYPGIDQLSSCATLVQNTFSSIDGEFVLSADRDECQSPDACGVNYVCNNTVGSYRCECLTGFVADCGAQNLLNPVCVGKKLTTTFAVK